MTIQNLINSNLSPISRIRYINRSKNETILSNITPNKEHLKAKYPTNNRVNFGAFFEIYSGLGLPRENKLLDCRNETRFFRDYETLEQMKKYIKKHFPKGTHIADFGCSNGEETRTIAMLLADINKDKRYKITGYDPVKSTIDAAQKGSYAIFEKDFGSKLHPFSKRISDNFLLKSDDELKNECDLDGNSEKEYERLVHYKQIFSQFFTKTVRVHNKKVIWEGNTYTVNATYFEANKELFDGIVNFQRKGISSIDKCAGKNTGVVVFKNVWYHLTNNFKYYPYEDPQYNLDTARKVVEKIYSVLPNNGILVCGRAGLDHFLGEYRNQSGRYCSSPFHKLLKESGFVPIFFDQCSDIEDVRVPSIWKKVSKKQVKINKALLHVNLHQKS